MSGKPEPIEGMSLAQVRDLLRILKGARQPFNAMQLLRNKAQLSEAAGRGHIAALSRAGFIAASNGDVQGLHVLTDTGSQFATKKLRRITPARKDELIRLVIERAEQIAGADDWAFEVDQLVLFGSALQDNLPDYGDVDIGLAIGFKRSYGDTRAALDAEYEFTGIPFHQMPEGLPEVRIGKVLKGRLPSIHIQGLEQVRQFGIPHRVIYQRSP